MSSLFPFTDPVSGRRLAADELIPHNFTALAPVVAPLWSPSLLLEERVNRHPWEIRAYTLDGLRLQMLLDPVDTLECGADETWHGGKLFPGSTLIIPAQMPTRYRWRESNFRVADVVIDSSFVAEHLPPGAKAENIPYHHGVMDGQIQRMIGLLRFEQNTGGLGGRLFGESIASALVAHVFAHYGDGLPAASSGNRKSSGLGERELARVAAHVAEHLASDVSLKSLADAAGYSVYHFSRLFKQTTRLTPRQYVLRERVKAAERLLGQGVSVTEAALSVGFYNQAHLARYMKRFLGVAPSQIHPRRIYRK